MCDKWHVEWPDLKNCNEVAQPQSIVECQVVAADWYIGISRPMAACQVVAADWVYLGHWHTLDISVHWQPMCAMWSLSMNEISLTRHI
jgi:hypothetical protein